MLLFPYRAAITAALLCLGAHAQNAFPGALGFGAIATGAGPDATTYHVTTLADSGAGSFRDAVSAPGRLVVFDVAGYVQLASAVTLSSSLTIDGTTAPSPGVGVLGGEVSASKRSNIVIRNMRFRQGTLDTDTGKSAINLGDASNVILDQCSFAFGQWDTIDAVGVVNLTVSNSIIAFPIGQQFGAHVETGPSSFVGNLWVSAHNRQPLAKDNTQFVGNVVYDYQGGYTVANTGGKFFHDIINNYFIAGPSTTTPSDAFLQMNAGQTVYASGNYIDGNKDGVLNGALVSTAGSATMASKPWVAGSPGLASASAAQAVVSVLAGAGAQPRDEVDALAVSQTASYGKLGSLIKSQADTGLSNGGYGTL